MSASALANTQYGACTAEETAILAAFAAGDAADRNNGGLSTLQTCTVYLTQHRPALSMLSELCCPFPVSLHLLTETVRLSSSQDCGRRGSSGQSDDSGTYYCERCWGQSGAAEPSEANASDDPTTELEDALASLKLEQFVQALQNLGCVELDDLQDLAAEDMAGIGMNAEEIERFQGRCVAHRFKFNNQSQYDRKPKRRRRWLELGSDAARPRSLSSKKGKKSSLSLASPRRKPTPPRGPAPPAASARSPAARRLLAAKQVKTVGGARARADKPIDGAQGAGRRKPAAGKWDGPAAAPVPAPAPAPDVFKAAVGLAKVVKRAAAKKAEMKAALERAAKDAQRVRPSHPHSTLTAALSPRELPDGLTGTITMAVAAVLPAPVCQPAPGLTRADCMFFLRPSNGRPRSNKCTRRQCWRKHGWRRRRLGVLEAAMQPRAVAQFQPPWHLPRAAWSVG